MYSNSVNSPAGYVDYCGRFKLLQLFFDHQESKYFPTLWVIGQRDAASSVTKAGCERFFVLSGYVLGPRRTRLNVRTYEHIAILAEIVNSVYIDDEWVAC